jgi:hypothetical protein
MLSNYPPDHDPSLDSGEDVIEDFLPEEEFDDTEDYQETLTNNEDDEIPLFEKEL